MKLETRLSELLKAVGPTRVAGELSVEVRGIEYDSRRVGPGSLFVAVPGEKADGHRFAEKALAAGVAALVVSDPAWFERLAAPAVRGSAVIVLADDSRLALSRLACACYRDPSFELDLVGVTGTNGKSTTCYLVESIFKARGRPAGLVGTVAYRVAGRERPADRTTPEAPDLQKLFREMVDAGCAGCAMEVSSHALSLRRVDGCRFKVAAFTNLTQDHLDYHGDMESYFQAKRLLFADDFGRGAAAAGAPPTAVVNVDDPYGRRLAEELRGRGRPLLACSAEDAGADVRAVKSEVSASGIVLEAATPAGPIRVRSALRGRFNVDNLLLAAGIGCALGLSADVIERGLGGLGRVPGRMEAVENRRNITIMIDYAHSPDSVERAVQAGLELAGARRTLVLAGCGGDRDRAKRPLMARAAARGTVALLTSDNPRTEDPLAILSDMEQGLNGGEWKKVAADSLASAPAGSYAVIPDRRAAIRAAVAAAAPGEVVLILGKGHEDYIEVNGVKSHFDDREEAARALEELP